MIDQLDRLFIHTNEQDFRVIRKGVGLQDVFHPSDELTARFSGNAPLFFQAISSNKVNLSLLREGLEKTIKYVVTIDIKKVKPSISMIMPIPPILKTIEASIGSSVFAASAIVVSSELPSTNSSFFTMEGRRVTKAGVKNKSQIPTVKPLYKWPILQENVYLNYK